MPKTLNEKANLFVANIESISTIPEEDDIEILGDTTQTNLKQQGNHGGIKTMIRMTKRCNQEELMAIMCLRKSNRISKPLPDLLLQPNPWL
jgi:hypothetical protein